MCVYYRYGPTWSQSLPLVQCVCSPYGIIPLLKPFTQQEMVCWWYQVSELESFNNYNCMGIVNHTCRSHIEPKLPGVQWAVKWLPCSVAAHTVHAWPSLQTEPVSSSILPSKSQSNTFSLVFCCAISALPAAYTHGMTDSLSFLGHQSTQAQSYFTTLFNLLHWLY